MPAIVVLLAGCSGGDAGVPPDPASDAATAPDAAAAPASEPAAAGASEDPAGALVVGEGFTVLLPGPPDVQRTDVPLADGTTAEAVTYQARAGEVFVGFSYADGAAGDGDAAGGRSSLLAAAEASARDTGGDLVLLEEVVVADRPAVRSRIVTAGGIVDAASFVDGDRLYTVQAVAAAGPDGTVDLDPGILDAVLATVALG